MNRIRFLAKSFGDNIEGTRVGLAKLIELLNTTGYRSAAIVVPTIGDVKHTILVDVLGEDLAKKLIRDRAINFNDGKKLSLCGQATLKNFKHEDAYLGLWASKYMIEDIEKLQTWKGAVVVTWLPADAEQWVNINNVTVIYDDGRG